MSAAARQIEPTIVGSETELPLEVIHVDPSWNSRAERNLVELSTPEESGFEGLKQSIKDHGQKEAALVRVVTDGATLSGAGTDRPFELVCGFRRHRAIWELAREGGFPAVLRCKVKELNAYQARLENGLENHNRKNLKASDQAFLVNELREKHGKSTTEIARALGLSDVYIKRLVRIFTLPPVVLEHWRNGTPIPATMTPVGMVELKANDPQIEVGFEEVEYIARAGLTPPEEIARYVALVGPKTKTIPIIRNGIRDKKAEKIVEFATQLGALCRAGVIAPGSLDKAPSWALVIGPRRRGYALDSGVHASQVRIAELAEAAADAFHRAQKKGVTKG